MADQTRRPQDRQSTGQFKPENYFPTILPRLRNFDRNVSHGEDTQCVGGKSASDPFREDGSGPADTQSPMRASRDLPCIEENADRIPTPVSVSFFDRSVATSLASLRNSPGLTSQFPTASFPRRREARIPRTTGFPPARE